MNHNVYILGAGFSAEAGYPVIANFKEGLIEAGDWLKRYGKPGQLDSVTRVLKFREDAGRACEYVSFEPNNIEQLFSLAAAKDASLTEHVCSAIASTLFYCRVRFVARPTLYGIFVDAQSEMGGPTQNLVSQGSLFAHYAELFASIRRDSSARTTVISLNYDNLVEDGCYEAGVRFAYGNDAGSADSFPLLKLHGSVNWGTERIYKSYDELLEMNDQVLLLPPTWNKVISDPRLQNAWRDAREALKTAKRVIVIGFSFPTTDHHIRFLLAAGLMGNVVLSDIVIVNPHLDTVLPNLEGLLSPSTKKLLRPVPMTAAGFLGSFEELTRINRASSKTELRQVQAN